MATIKGLPKSLISDASHINALVNALANAAGITDDAQTYIRPVEVRWGGVGRRIYTDGSDNLVLEDTLNGAETLTTLAAGPGLPGTPPLLGNLHPRNSSAITADRIYLHPVVVAIDLTMDGLRLWNGGTIAGNVLAGLYSLGGSRLAQSNSTALVGVSAFQNIAFTGGYATVPGVYLTAVIFSNAAHLAGQMGRNPVITKIVDPGSYTLPASITVPASVTSDGSWPAGIPDINGGIF